MSDQDQSRPDPAPQPQPQQQQPPPQSSQPAQPQGASRATAPPMPLRYQPPRPLPGPMAMPPPPPPRGNFGRGFALGSGAGLGLGLVTLVLGLLGALVSALTFAGMAAAVAGSTDLTQVRTIWGANNAATTLRAIDIAGPILADASEGSLLTAGVYGYEVAEVIDKMTAEDADGLVLLMNTPGGSVNGSRAIADAVERYKGRTGKKAVAYVQGLSASGGMYAMAGADKIVADHGSLVGSIGIIMGPFDQYKNVTALTGSLLASGVVTEGGITSEYLTQGKSKDFGNPFRAMTPEERQHYLTGLANEYNNFVGWVSKHRDIPAATIRDTYGALIFDTARAQKNKLIDATLGRDEAFRDFAKLAGADPNNTRVVVAEEPNPFAKLLGAEARVHGRALPATAEGGQPARATARMCTGERSILVYSGSPAAVCG